MTDAGEIPVPNSSGARWCNDASGRQWACKSIASNDLIAEAVGYLLSVRLAIPTPRAAIYETEQEQFWLTERIRNAAHWDATRFELLHKPTDLGAMLALDALLGNWDRHARNILVSPSADGRALDIWSIDMGDSFVAHLSDFRELDLNPPKIDNLARGIQADMIEEGLLACADRAGQLDPALLDDLIGESCLIAKSLDREADLVQILRKRFAAARPIVDKYLQQIKKRP